MKKVLVKLLTSLLDDDYGISEESWEQLNLLVIGLCGHNVPSEVACILDRVEATDGRFYLTK